MARIPQRPDAPRIMSKATAVPMMGNQSANLMRRSGLIAGRALNQGAQALDDIAWRSHKKAEAMDLMSATSRYRAESYLLEHGGQREDGTEVTGYRNVRGRESIEAEKEAADSLDELRDEIGGGLKGDLGDRWKLENHQAHVDSRRRGAGYVRGETDRVGRQDWEDSLVGATSQALGALNTADELGIEAATEEFGRVVRDTIGLAEARAEEMGWGDDWVDTRIDQWRSSLVAEGVKSLIDQDKPGLADTLYGATKEFVQPKEQNTIEAMLSPAKDRDKALAKNAELFAEVDWDYTSDQAEVIWDTITAETDANIKAVMIDDARVRFGSQDKIRTQRTAENFNRLYNGLSEHKDWAKLEQDEFFEKLEPRHKGSLRIHWDNLRKGESAKSDYAYLYMNWEYKPITDDDGEIVRYEKRSDSEKADMDILTEFGGRLSPQDFDELRREQNGVEQRVKGTGRGHIAAVGDILGRFNDVLKQWGGKDLKPEQKGYMRMMARRMAEAKEQETGKNLTGEQMDEILGELFRPVHLERGWRTDPKLPAGIAGALTATEQQNLYVPEGEIPPGDIALMKSYLRENDSRISRGDEIPVRALQELYAEHLSGMNPHLSDYMSIVEGEREDRLVKAGRKSLEDVASMDEDIGPAMQDQLDQDIAEAGMLGGSTPENRQLVMRWIQEENQRAFTDEFKREFLDPHGPRTGEARAARAEITEDFWRLVREEGLTMREARERLNLPPTVLSLLKPDEAAKLEAEWMGKAGAAPPRALPPGFPPGPPGPDTIGGPGTPGGDGE